MYVSHKFPHFQPAIIIYFPGMIWFALHYDVGPLADPCVNSIYLAVFDWLASFMVCYSPKSQYPPANHHAIHL